MIGLRVEGVTGAASSLLREDGAWSVLYGDVPASPRALAPLDPPERALPCLPRDGARARTELPWREPDATAGWGRRDLLTGPDATVSLLRVTRETPTTLDLDGDVILCAVDGRATVHGPFGTLRVDAAEHAWIPRGVPWRITSGTGFRALCVSARAELSWPAPWRLGPCALRHRAPLRVRDVRGPVWSPPPRLRPPEGGYALRVRRDGAWWTATQSTDPASCIGWEGSVYPVAFAWEAPLLRARRGEVVPLFEGAAVGVSSWVAEGDGLDDGADRAVLVVGSDGEPALWLLPAGCAASSPERPGDMLVALRTQGPLALTADGAVLAGR